MFNCFDLQGVSFHVQRNLRFFLFNVTNYFIKPALDIFINSGQIVLHIKNVFSTDAVAMPNGLIIIPFYLLWYILVDI